MLPCFSGERILTSHEVRAKKENNKVTFHNRVCGYLCCCWAKDARVCCLSTLNWKKQNTKNKNLKQTGLPIYPPKKVIMWSYFEFRQNWEAIATAREVKHLLHSQFNVNTQKGGTSNICLFMHPPELGSLNRKTILTHTCMCKHVQTHTHAHIKDCKANETLEDRRQQSSKGRCVTKWSYIWEEEEANFTTLINISKYSIFFPYKIKTGIIMKDSKCFIEQRCFPAAVLQAVRSLTAPSRPGTSC